MASEHIARGYDEELRKLNNTVAEMGAKGRVASRPIHSMGSHSYMSR